MNLLNRTEFKYKYIISTTFNYIGTKSYRICNMKDFTNYWNAISFAFIKHGNLKRKAKDVPYVIHPIRVSTILRATGFNEFEHEDLMIAALFHDLVEDTDTNLKEIEKQFGKKISLIVAELTKPKGAKGPEKEKWLETFIEKSNEAKIIKMADRIDNLMEKGDVWTEEKQKTCTNKMGYHSY